MANIKWREQDIVNINRAVRNFNAKIRRAIAKDPAARDYLPDKISSKELKKNISTRQEFNREVRSLKRFSRKGAEQKAMIGSVPVTKWERKETAIQIRILNAQRKKNRERFGDLEVVAGGQKTGYKRAEIPSLRMQEFKPKTTPKPRSKREWNKFLRSLRKQISESYRREKRDKYIDNYIKGLKQVFGSRADDIAWLIKQMDPDVVIETMFSDQEAAIDFMYDPLEVEARLATVTDIWENVSIMA